MVDVAKAMGISTKLDPSILSMPLGTLEVSPLDMAGAYGVLAAEGVKHQTHYVTQIVDANGKVVYDRGQPPGEQVIARDTALRATATLQGVITGGTGTRAKLAGNRPAAGKTGTAEDNGDAWFAGYTPQLATAVWVGHKRDRFTVQLPGFGNVQGGNAPATLWRAFMDRALAAQEVLPFTPPPPSPRAAVRVYLPGGECGVGRQADAVGAVVRAGGLPGTGQAQATRVHRRHRADRPGALGARRRPHLRLPQGSPADGATGGRPRGPGRSARRRRHPTGGVPAAEPTRRRRQ